jgi:FixJ family two-component response regulator
MTQLATVYVIDDDHSVQRALRRLLRAAGYDVVVCDGAEAFLSLKDLPSRSCLLVDIQMPVKTGLDLLDILAREQRDIPAILLSGHVDSGTLARATASGAITLLSKPFEADVLLDALQLALSPHGRNASSIASRP